jgi:hypothetical protein
MNFIYLLSKNFNLDGNYIENLELFEFQYYIKKLEDYLKQIANTTGK